MAEIPNGDAEETESAEEKGGEKRSRLAIASLMLGVLAFVGTFVLPAILVNLSMLNAGSFFASLGFVVFAAILAIFLGHVALFKMRKSPVPMMGRRLAIAGLVLGYSYVFLIALAYFVIPHYLLRGRTSGNETAAIGNLRTITGAQTGYSAAHGVYAGSFAELTDDTNGPAFLLGTWGETVSKTGHLFKLKATDNGNCYEVTSPPTTPGRTGIRDFFSDCSGVIRWSWNKDGPADSASTPIGE